MRVLITGGTGFVGYSLADRLAARIGKQNIQILCSPRPRTVLEQRRRLRLRASGFDVIEHDLLAEDTKMPPPKPFDVLYHLAAFTETESRDPAMRVNDTGTERLISQLAANLRGKRIIFASSLAAVDRPQADNRPQAETDACAPRTEYGRSKLEAERIVRRMAGHVGYDYTILRLPTVCGPGFRPGGMFAKIENDLRRKRLTMRIAWPGRISLAFVDDVAEALTALGCKDHEWNTVFHFAPPDAPTFDEVIERAAHVLKLERRRIELPEFVWAALRRVLWVPWLQRLLPDALRIAAWRMSLVITDGMVGAGAKLDSAIQPSYTPVAAALHATYTRPALTPEYAPEALSCSVIVPCRNERGNIERLVQRLPALGRQCEIIFVEGHSRDGTFEECERVRRAYAALDIKVLRQSGTGKGDAVLRGFAAATGDVLMILDADLSVPPEQLPQFLLAAARGPGRLLVGSRFVLPMESGAMPFLNYCGNRLFTAALNSILATRLTDVLCGTKVIWRQDYERLRAGGLGFGAADPFGDFDLLFGAAQLGLLVEEIPVPYRRRSYGTTQIRRFRDGYTLVRLTMAGRQLLAARGPSARAATVENPP